MAYSRDKAKATVKEYVSLVDGLMKGEVSPADVEKRSVKIFSMAYGSNPETPEDLADVISVLEPRYKDFRELARIRKKDPVAFATLMGKATQNGLEGLFVNGRLSRLAEPTLGDFDNDEEVFNEYKVSRDRDGVGAKVEFYWKKFQEEQARPSRR